MFLELSSRSLTRTVVPRAARPEVRNPVLALPCAADVAAMPPEARRWLLQFLQEVRNEARDRAAESLRRHKAPLYLYWKVIQVWSGHMAKVLRSAAPAVAAKTSREAITTDQLKEQHT